MLCSIQAVIPAGLKRSAAMSFVVLTDTSGNLRNQQILGSDLKVIPFPYYIEKSIPVRTMTVSAETVFISVSARGCG